MTGGYAGKILKINLTNKTKSTINTSDYEDYGGGYGISAAIFWDMLADKLPMDAFDPDNTVTFMTSPLSGTLTPGQAGRTEVTGIGPHAYPIGWYTRSNFGGRFAGQLKLAGWDGIVIQGASSDPVWLKIVNDTVTFEDASTLWGLDIWTAQQKIWQMQEGNSGSGEWEAAGDGYTTQHPAVACIGPVGESGSVLGSIVHDAGNGSGQGGFGGVLGSKKLKAISVIGTGAVAVANPQALYDARKWITHVPPDAPGTVLGPLSPGMARGGLGPGSGPRGCMGCPWPCRHRFDKGSGNESQCFEGTGPSADMVQKWGANQCEMQMGVGYLKALNDMGVLGSGKEINSNIPMELGPEQISISDAKLFEYVFESIVNGTDIGPDIKDGFVRAAIKWGREDDWKSGIAMFPYWGCPAHGYEPRTELTWGYGSILGERDVNEHGYNTLVYWYSIYGGINPPVPVQEVAEISTDKMVPFEGDPYMFDFSDANMYSTHLAKATAWQAYYSRSWKQSIGFCDWAWPSLCDGNAADNKGMTPDAEPMFFNAVTGKNLTFADAMLGIGRKNWNLCNAIWILQGRDRDMVKYADYIYDSGTAGFAGLTGPYYPVSQYINGVWVYQDAYGRNIDRTGFEELKTNFYELMEWDTSTGWPTRATLEGLDLGFVADKLEAEGKLGT